MKEISQAIIKVMDEVNWVAKNMTVGSWQNSYKWVSDKDVKQVIRDSMIKNWLSLLPIWVTPRIKIDRWEEVDSYSKTGAMKTKQSIFTEVETRYILLHTSGESLELSWYGQWVDTQDKWAGKATTYALKNTLLNMFLIPTGVDTDDTHSDDLPVPKRKAKQDNWLTFQDYVDSIRMEKDINHIRTLFIQCDDSLDLTESQLDMLKSEARKRTDFLEWGAKNNVLPNHI